MKDLTPETKRESPKLDSNDGGKRLVEPKNYDLSEINYHVSLEGYLRELDGY